MAVPNPKEIGAIQKLIGKNQWTFNIAVFFLMFGITYYINIRKNNQAEQFYKELYQAEKKRNNDLTDQLLINAGIIQRQKEVIIKADSTLKDNVMDKVDKLIE